MSNMSSIISSHSKRLLWPRNTEYECNCEMLEYSPLQNKCHMPSLIYQADVAKVAQIKVAIYALVLQKHLSKHSLQITTKVSTMNNTKKAHNCQNIYVC